MPHASKADADDVEFGWMPNKVILQLHIKVEVQFLQCLCPRTKKTEIAMKYTGFKSGLC
jgi:hypothetical protein